ncbi:MAG: thioredoxin domain-containing protein [Flavobacteriaceae bacterium]
MQKIILIALIALFQFSCNSSKKEPLKTHKYTNDLINETSPYLLQHAHNPVHWKPWNETTLNEAKQSNKLMIISVGYAACHWCHVMEHESFEDSTVAAVMNKNFISIKVDREERPDVDQTYINAVQLMTGNAGWPLNVIALPDGRPVYGGTYFKKEDWIAALQQLQQLYEESPQKLIDYANMLEEGIKSIDLVSFNHSEINFSEMNISPLMNTWKKSLDTVYGGSRGAPKFMMPNQLAFFMRYAYKNNDEALQNHVTLTLEKMAFGGLYDQVEGGFSRYSTDEKWHIPHFEKMLYDNAQLVSLYSQAYALTKNPLYKNVVEETLSFVAKELTNTEGAFYSSLDADSLNEEGDLVEGDYYTFSKEQLQSFIPQNDWTLFEDYYNVSSYGKWEAENNYVLIRQLTDDAFISKHNIDAETLLQKKSSWNILLREHRNTRSKPRLDDKTLTSWNGLMIKGYVDAYKVFKNESYLKAALTNANFILSKQLQPNGALYHNYKSGKSSINGYLEDYASVIDAFIALYEATLDENWIKKANELTQYTFENFFDEEKHMFYFTSKEDKEIISRSIEYRDNVISASNSIMAKNLFVLAHHFDNETNATTALQMLKNVQPELEKYPSGFANWLDLLLNYQSKYYEIVVVGKDAMDKVSEINKKYIPNKLIAGNTKASNASLLMERYVEGRTLIYVCVNNTCKLPVEKVEDALKFVGN